MGRDDDIDGHNDDDGNDKMMMEIVYVYATERERAGDAV